MSRIAALVVVGVLLLVGGCMSAGSEGGQTRPDYTPVPDDELFARVSGLPGVDRADLSFNDNFSEFTYLGEVDISPEADAQTVLDTIYATLRQGRFDADMNIIGYQSGRPVRLAALKNAGVASELEERYGPQPGDGTPPGD